MASFRGVEFVECVDHAIGLSPEEAFANDECHAIRNYLIKWDDRRKFRDAFLGYTAVRATGGVRYLHRQTPHYCDDVETSPATNNGLSDAPPKLIGAPFLFATRIQRIVGHGVPGDGVQKSTPSIGNAGGTARYEKALCTVQYESLTYDVLDDDAITKTGGVPDESYLERYVTVIIKPSAEYLTLPSGSFRWIDTAGTGSPKPNSLAGSPIPGAPGKIVPVYDLSITWHDIPRLAVGIKRINQTGISASLGPVDEALGRVNNAEFAGCQLGTLLLVAAEATPIRSPTGTRNYNINYRFKYFGIGHNKLYKCDAAETSPGHYECVGGSSAASNYDDKSDGRNIYDWYDFRKLFRVPA